MPDASNHLQPYFRRELDRVFGDSRSVSGPAIEYLSGLLVRFCRTPDLFPKSRDGKPLTALADWMIEAQGHNGTEDAASYQPFEEVRLIRRLGDHALFMTGLFHEYVQRRSNARYYIQVGRDAYTHVADFEAVLDRRRSEVFSELSETFEVCAAGLSQLRQPTSTGSSADGEICLSPVAW